MSCRPFGGSEWRPRPEIEKRNANDKNNNKNNENNDEFQCHINKTDYQKIVN